VKPFDDVAPRLFPPFVHTVLAPTAEVTNPWPDEVALVAGAAPLRRRELLSGRACAHAALRSLGRDDGPIGVGTGRQPVWPQGVVGSISHAGAWCGAAVAAADDAWGLGFDLEVLEPPLSPEVEHLVLSPAERRQIGHRGAYGPKIAFSVKECVYKAVYPRTGWRLGFGDVTVAPDLDAGTYTASVAPWFSHAGLDASALDGRFVVSHGYVFTGLTITE